MCTSCTSAVIDIKFSKKIDFLEIIFPIEIKFVDYTGPSSTSNSLELCDYFLDDQTDNKYGINPQCRLDSTKRIIYIELGDNSTVFIGDIVALKQSKI